MEIFDNLAKAAKGFFVEPDPTGAPAKTAGSPLPSAQPSNAAARPTSPAPGQAEQRHLDHMASLLAGDGKDFAAYMKMVKSMAAAGLSGPLLYQTAFNAFSAVNGSTVPALLASAGEFEAALATDRDKVLARHREKMGEAVGNGAPGVVMQLTEKERQLAADLAALSQQLQAKQQQLADTQQQLATERQKTQAALASYELAQSAALAELQAHRQAATSFLSGGAAA
ncbi:hypothetical protein GO988_12255 [Hymenobacter sp. HMF4947]|uniref:Uncharacterized protein n=1 Tax=Hymenobacter ginkgonis TaxID=2682976 RepID=A0A7K1TFB2_9BACT|nr:hypothetical protein [Hymenobacter ginkgonis]MVN77100.1 hypothetical protein [Hymenobacter ginkgonis]